MTPFKKILNTEKEKIKTIAIPFNVAKINYTYTINMYKTPKLYLKR